MCHTLLGTPRCTRKCVLTHARLLPIQRHIKYRYVGAHCVHMHSQHVLTSTFMSRAHTPMRTLTRHPWVQTGGEGQGRAGQSEPLTSEPGQRFAQKSPPPHLTSHSHTLVTLLRPAASLTCSIWDAEGHEGVVRGPGGVLSGDHSANSEFCCLWAPSPHRTASPVSKGDAAAHS